MAMGSATPAHASKMAMMGNVLSGLTSAGSGVLGLIQSLRGNKQTSPMGSMGHIATNLNSSQGSQASALPHITPTQVPGAGQVPTLDMDFLRTNPKFLQLLGAYTA
jgi:hypothetical protein